MRIGIVIGKFIPLHNGSLSLCKVADELSERLVIIVLNNFQDKISIKLRESWLQQEISDPIIKNINIDPFNLTGNILKPLLQEISEKFDDCEIHFFGSEPYIAKLADSVKAQFTVLDPERLGQNINSASILSDPYGNWLNMPLSVRKSLIRRVVLIGPESVGKSSLAKRINMVFPNLLYLPEYGRNYETFRRKKSYDLEELLIISRTHAAHRNALLPFSGPIFIKDTDELATSVWSEMLIEKTFPALEKQIKLPELYLLMDPSVPFVQEKTRYFNNQKRKEFFSRIQDKLDSYKANYNILTGSWKQREEKALSIISGLLSKKPDWSKF